MQEGDCDSGTYLITGFRGMGKTSLLREAIFELNKKTELSKSEKEADYRRRSYLGLGKRLTWLLLITSFVFFLLYENYSAYAYLVFGSAIVIVSIILYFLRIDLKSKFPKERKEGEEEEEMRHNYFWEKPNPMAFWSAVKLLSFGVVTFFILIYLLYPVMFCDQKWIWIYMPGKSICQYSYKNIRTQ